MKKFLLVLVCAGLALGLAGCSAVPVVEGLTLDKSEQMGIATYRVPSDFVKTEISPFIAYHPKDSPEEGFFYMTYQSRSEMMIADWLWDENHPEFFLEKTAKEMQTADGVMAFTVEYGLTVAERPAMHVSYGQTIQGKNYILNGYYIMGPDGGYYFSAAEREGGDGVLRSTLPALLESISFK